MNIKIGDLLFEENNSNKIHEVFENNLLKEEDETDAGTGDEVNLSKPKLGLIAKRLCGLMASKFPDVKKVFSGDVSQQQVATGLKKLEKLKISGNFEVNFFNLKGVKGNPPETPDISQADLAIYSELGFAMFEVIAKGQKISGENSQGNNIVEFFAIPIPGFSIKEEDANSEERMKFHEAVFGLDLSKIDKDKEIIEIRHVGIGKSFQQVPVVEGNDTINKLRGALKNKNYTQIATFIKKSSQGTAKSTVNDPLTGATNNDSGDDATQEPSESVRESYLHNHRLSDLLFEKKSLKRLNTNQKKQLVENYFNVNYRNLNNYDKRDFLYFANILLESDRKSILLEATPKEIDNAIKKGQAAEARGDDYNGHPVAKAVGNIPETEKEKESWLSKFKKVVPKLKDKAVTGLKDWIMGSGLDPKVVDTAQDVLSQAGWEAGADEFIARDDIQDISGEFSNTSAVVKDKEEGEGAEESEETSPEDGSSEDADESEEEDSLKSIGITQEAKDIILKELAENVKDPKLLSFYQNESALNSFVGETVKKASEYKAALAKLDISAELENIKKSNNWKETTQEDRDKAEEIVKGMLDGNSEFNKDLDSYINALRNLQSTSAESDTNYINSLINEKFNATKEAFNDEKDHDKAKEVYKYIAILSAREQKIKAACLLQTATEIILEVHANLNAPPKELIALVDSVTKMSEGDESGAPENVAAAARVNQALGGLGIPLEDFIEMFKSDVKETFKFKNTNLLLEDKKTKKHLIKIGGKVAIDANGKINVSTIKSVHKSLDSNKNYKKIKDIFYKKFKAQLGKDISKATDDEVQEQLITFFEDLQRSGAGTTASRGGSATGTAGGTAAQSIISKLWNSKWKILAWSALAIGSFVVWDVFENNAQVVKGIWAALGIIVDNVFFNSPVTPAVPVLSVWTQLGTALPSLAKVGALFATAGTSIANGWTWLVGSKAVAASTMTLASGAPLTAAIPGSPGLLGLSGGISPLIAWAKAPFLATTLGSFASTAFPCVTTLLVGIGSAAVISFGAVVWLTGFFAGLAGFTAKAAAWKVLGLDVILSGKAYFALFAPGLGWGLGTILLAAIVIWWWKRSKKKKTASGDMKIGEALKIYILAAATNKSYEDIVRILGMNPSEYMAELTKDILPGDDEIKIIIDALDNNKVITEDHPIPQNKDEFENVIKAYSAMVEKLDKNPEITSSTSGLLEELGEALAKDHLLLVSETITSDEFVEYYTQNSIKKMAMSYLNGNRQHMAMSDINKFLLIDDKETLLASLQSSRNKTIESLSPLGNFEPSDDPIFYIVSQIASAKKGKELSLKYNIAKMIEKFPEKISDDQIDIDKIFSALSQSNAHIAANDIKQFKSRGFLEKITLSSKEGQKQYAEEYLSYIHKNLSKGVEGCINQSVFTESLAKRSNLLLEVNNFNLRNHSEMKRHLLTEHGSLNEWSWKSVTNLTGWVSGGGALAGAGLYGAMAANIAGIAPGATLGTITGTGMLAKLGVTLAGVTVGIEVLLLALAGVAVIKIGGELIGMFKDARFEGNFNPYKDKQYTKTIAPHVRNIVKTQIGLSYAKVLMQHKEALKKVGVEIVGEDHPMFAAQMKEVQSQVQVAELKKSLNEEGETLYTSIRELGYYVRNANQDPGIGDFIPDNHLNKFIDDICLKSGAPLEAIFKALKDEKAKDAKQGVNAGVSESFVYKEGLGFLLEQDDTKRNIKISLNEAFSNIKKVTKSFLYSNIDLNGLVNQEIIKIVEPQFNKGWRDKLNLSKKFNQQRGGGKETFMYQKISDAMSEVTGIDPERCMAIINNKKSRTSQTRKEKIGSNLELSHRDVFVHNAGLGILLEKPASASSGGGFGSPSSAAYSPGGGGGGFGGGPSGPSSTFGAPTPSGTSSGSSATLTPPTPLKLATTPPAPTKSGLSMRPSPTSGTTSSSAATSGSNAGSGFDKLNYVEKTSSGNYVYHYETDSTLMATKKTPFTTLEVDPSGKMVSLKRHAAETHSSLSAKSNLATDTTVQKLTGKINAEYVVDTSGQVVAKKGTIGGLNLKGTGVSADQLSWLDYLPTISNETLGYLSVVGKAYLAVNVFKGFLAAPISERSLVPLVSDIDWARLVRATYASQIVYLLEANRDKLADLGIEIVGSLPDEARKLMSGAKEAMSGGGGKEATGNLGVLSGAALNRLKTQKGGKKVTEADLAKVIEADIRKMLYAYHKSYRTETYENIQQAIGNNKTTKGYKKAKSGKSWKTNIGLVGLTAGAALLTGGTSLLPSIIGFPAMLGGGLIYADRLSNFEDDQRLTADESSEAERSAIKAVLKDDIKALTTLIIDISKEAKGITESLRIHSEKRNLAYLLFEAISDSRIDVKQVINKLKSSSILVYDGSIKQGTEEFKSAESYIIDIVCSMLDSICGIEVVGAEKYSNPQVVVQNITNSIVDEEAPVGEPIIPSAAAIAASQSVPQMNQPINPAQFMGMMNQMGGPMMMMMMPMMMMSMMPMMQGQQQQGLDFSKFFEQMSQGKLTTEQAVDQVADAIDDQTNVSNAAKTASGQDFKDIFSEVLKINRNDLPVIHKKDVIKIFRGLQSLKSILNSPEVSGIMTLTPDGQKLFGASGAKSKPESAKLKQFIDFFINGRLNVKEDDFEYTQTRANKKSCLINMKPRWFADNVLSIDDDELKKKLTVDDDYNVQAARYIIIDIFNKMYLSEIFNKVFEEYKVGTFKQYDIAMIKDAIALVSGRTPLDDGNDDAMKNISDPFKHTEIVVERRLTHKSIIKRKRKDNVLSEDYLMGDLSSLLFNESVSIERKSKKEVKSSNSNINLSKEWLRIWDI